MVRSSLDRRGEDVWDPGYQSRTGRAVYDERLSVKPCFFASAIISSTVSSWMSWVWETVSDVRMVTEAPWTHRGTEREGVRYE